MGSPETNFARSALQAQEIAQSVHRRASCVESETGNISGGYQLRRSPFVQRQMAKGKRFERQRTNTMQVNSSGEGLSARDTKIEIELVDSAA